MSQGEGNDLGTDNLSPPRTSSNPPIPRTPDPDKRVKIARSLAAPTPDTKALREEIHEFCEKRIDPTHSAYDREKYVKEAEVALEALITSKVIGELQELLTFYKGETVSLETIQAKLLKRLNTLKEQEG
jgi:hypothetical protein